MGKWTKLGAPSVRALFERWRDCSLTEIEWRISMIRRQTLYQHLTPDQWSTLDKMRTHVKEKKAESTIPERSKRAVSFGDIRGSQVAPGIPDSVFLRQIFPPKKTHGAAKQLRRPTIKDL